MLIAVSQFTSYMCAPTDITVSKIDHIYTTLELHVFMKYFLLLIAERERANLVVQLARFFYIYIYIYIFVCMSPYRNLLRNSKYTSAKFHVHRVSRMRKYISFTVAVRFYAHAS